MELKLKCSEMSGEELREKIREYLRDGRSFTLESIPFGSQEQYIRKVRNELNGFKIEYRERYAWRLLVITLVGFLCLPVALIALGLTWLQWFMTIDAKFVIVKGLFTSAIDIKALGSKAENSKQAELKTQSDLPEEDAELVSADEVCSGGVLNLAKALAYFAQTRRRYEIDSKVWAPVRDGLVRIKKRQKDETLYLGVVGEASAGKSTFVNAMLGFEFLKEDTCLGTTAAATILKYGEKLRLEVFYNDGKVESFDSVALGITGNGRENWSSRLLEIVHKYTADESVSQTVRCVEVSLPIDNAFLKSGVAVVDTPGINSENPRHNDVTTRAIKEICDAALILVPANVPLSSCLSEYVKNNLLEVLGRCILVVTQADKLRLRERAMQVKYIRSRLKSAVGTDVACSYKTAAYYVLKRDDYGKASDADVKAFREEFTSVMESIKDVVGKCKTAAILEKMLIFLNVSLIPLLRNVITDKKHELTKRKQSLEKNRLVDVDRFITSEQDVSAASFDGVVVTEEQIIEELTKVRTSFEEQMFDSIYSVEDRDGLKQVMDENSVRSRLNGLQIPFKDSLRTLCKPYRDSLSTSMEAFHARFAESYKKLQNISRNESLMTVARVSEQDLSVAVLIDNFGDAIDAQLGADAMKSLGGAGAGAMIGSFICPGLGTVIGGVLGGIFGALFGKSLDTLKGEAYSSICSVAADWLSQMIPQANSYVDSYRASCRERLMDNIASYKDTYGGRIAEIIREEKAEQQRMENLTRIAETDIDLLQSLQPKVEELVAASRISGQGDEGDSSMGACA